MKKVLSKLFHLTLIYKLGMTLYFFKNYIYDYSYVSDIIYTKDFKDILKRYLFVEFKKDWIGRLYAVVNPTLDINGKYDVNASIIEIDGNNTNNNAYVETWLYKQLSVVSDVFHMQYSGLFDAIGAEVKHVGPKEHDNYLIVFDLVNRKETAIYFKSMIKQLFLYCVIALIIFLFI